MKSQHYYSASWNNFFELPEDADALPSEWPGDVVAVTDMDYQQLQAGVKTGKIIVPDDAGKPVLSWRYHYSASRQGFYPVDDKREYESGAGWPADAIPVSDSDYKALFEGQAKGKIIVPDDTGYPVLAEPVVDFTAQAISKCDSLLSEANAITADWRTELTLDVIADDDRVKLIAWMQYIKALKAVDTSSPADIVWPDKPAV
ncbi:tail fiber assembly protein [Citrobacter freundii]|uniref:tail fiber assembly protein n=2 Tax=Citrobacter freundii TaxID=546 RepID=UPI001A346839|nr:tail fiber assembly protein [Citrobacter freundii]WHE73206.1 tail fiber assembly protein [Citrobacter freundii]WHE78098.1 tail fiber assembly protein [Citrobacter freundii]HAT3934849.1 tail fiber assembly protein [Citrobacter freundii]HAT3940043.1 tail fiber assembly protein [Citrobacter freundii]